MKGIAQTWSAKCSLPHLVSYLKSQGILNKKGSVVAKNSPDSLSGLTCTRFKSIFATIPSEDIIAQYDEESSDDMD